MKAGFYVGLKKKNPSQMGKSHNTNLSSPGSGSPADNVGGPGQPLQLVNFRAVCRQEPLAFFCITAFTWRSLSSVDVQQTATLREGRGSTGNQLQELG